jgi:hypothetical protein
MAYACLGKSEKVNEASEKAEESNVGHSERPLKSEHIAARDAKVSLIDVVVA